MLLLFKDGNVPVGEVRRTELQGLGPLPSSVGEMWVTRGFHNSKVKQAANQGTLLFQKILDWVILPLFEKAFKTVKVYPRADNPVGVVLNERGIFQFDGQQEFINVLENPENIAKFTDMNIDAMKHSAGCSLAVQTNDVCKAFPVIKSGIKTGKYEGDSNTSLVKQANARLDELKKCFTEISTTTIKNMKEVYRLIQPVLGPALVSHNIIIGGKVSGQWDPTKNDCDFSAMLARCTNEYTLQQREDFEACALELGEKFRIGYKITEPMLDAKDLPKTKAQEKQEQTPGRVQRDDLCTNRQRALLITHETFETSQEKKAQRDEIKKAEAAATNATKVQKATQKLEAAEQKKRKEEEKKAKQTEDDERARLVKTLQTAPQKKKPPKNDAQCFMCGSWWSNWQTRGNLPEDHKNKVNIWHNCSQCDMWFCPEHGGTTLVGWFWVLIDTFVHVFCIFEIHCIYICSFCTCVR